MDEVHLLLPVCVEVCKMVDPTFSTGRPACSGRRCGWAGRIQRWSCTLESAGSCWGLRRRCWPAVWRRRPFPHPDALPAREPRRPLGGPGGSRPPHLWPGKTPERSPAPPWTLDWWRQMENFKTQWWQRRDTLLMCTVRNTASVLENLQDRRARDHAFSIVNEHIVAVQWKTTFNSHPLQLSVLGI